MTTRSETLKKRSDNFMKAHNRNFTCLMCGEQPSEITFDYEESGDYCIDCLLKRRLMFIVLLVVVYLIFIFGVIPLILWVMEKIL